MESIAPLAKVLGETEFYDFTEKVFTLPAVRALLMEAVNANNQAKEPSHVSMRGFFCVMFYRLRTEIASEMVFS